MDETTITPAARQEAIDCFWETIPPVWRRLQAQIRDNLANHFDITVEQFHILRHIRRGDCSMSEIAVERHTSRSAISQTVDTLVEKGLVSRCQDPDDRRYVQLELTAAGNALIAAIFAKNREWMAGRMNGLSAEELTDMVRGLNQLKRAFVDAEPRDKSRQSGCL
ncbi:MAG TPA: MarR family transcriptional regulator [Anaerolineaceae bacterium]|jgi:DNA-binding MarR family transcriptional regulator|nr:MarR family transcriptional regulator [Anaerolineaceae bacterium]